MKLDQFVTQTLVSILSGMKNADEEAHKRGLSKYTAGTFSMANYGEKTSDAKYINFDVAVTASSEISGGVKGEGNILVASLDSNVETAHTQENVSRVRFKILYRD